MGDHLSQMSLRNLLGTNADRVGARQEIEGLRDIEAVRHLQRKEGYTACYGNDVALAPGEDGLCMVRECCWRNFCSAYRSHAAPLDKYFSQVSRREDLTEFTSFLLGCKEKQPLDVGGVAVTVRSQAELSSLSRKLVLGVPRSTICESSDSFNALKPIQLSFNAQSTSSPHAHGFSHYTRYYKLERNVWWTANAEQIFNWQAAAKSLIDSSALNYSPHVTTEAETVGVWKTNRPEFTGLATPTFKQLNTPHQAVPSGDVYVSDPALVPLINLEIPFLETASLDDLHKIIQDYPEELSSFRNFLYRSIDGLHDKQLSSPTFGSDLLRIRRDLDDQIRKLRSDLKKAQVKHYTEMIGGISAAFALVVYCFVQQDSHTWAVIGPGGFAYALSTKFSEYLISKLSLKDSPVYFLWMLGPGTSI